MDYSSHEQLICSLSRELQDGEVIGIGNNSPIPAAASLLAQYLHAPLARVYIMGSMEWPFEGTKEFFDFMQRGSVDVFFLSGGQIDQGGNINLHVIDDYKRPRVRLPGGAGAAVVSFMCKRIILYKLDHNPMGFVNKVDFLSATARSNGNVFRRGTVSGVFTPLAVFRLDSETSTLYLHSLMPGVDSEQVQVATGFDIDVKDAISYIPPPTQDELRILRTKVKEKLTEVYPEFANQL